MIYAKAISQRKLISVLFLSLDTAVPVLLTSTARGAEGSDSTLACSARVDNPRPTDYLTVTVFVHTIGGAHVTTTAHYRTTSTVETTVASHSGSAVLSYRISRATSGFRVVVTVQVRNGTRSGTCRTYFTPN
jgi:hypothetical protein